MNIGPTLLSGLFLCLVSCLACSKKADEGQMPPTATSNPQAVAPSAPVFGAAAAAAGIQGTLATDPSPPDVCETTGLGTTTLKWTVNTPQKIEIRVAAPDGALLTMSMGTNGSVKTGNWLRKGTLFYLQNAADGVPRTLDNTIAKLEIDAVATKP